MVVVAITAGCAVNMRIDEDSFSFHYQKITGEAYE